MVAPGHPSGSQAGGTGYRSLPHVNVPSVTPTGPRRVVTVFLTALIAGCSSVPATAAPSAPAGGLGAPVSTESTNATPARASSAPASLPDLALTNVHTETAQATGATVGPAGGTLSAAGSDGTTFSLAIPANAIPTPTRVALYPVQSIAGLPAGDTLTAGVQLAPEGLELAEPATLTITLPGEVDAAQLTGFVWRGDAERPAVVPVVANATTVTLRIHHFSGGGVGNGPTAPNVTCSTASDMTWAFTRDIHEAALSNPNARADFTNDLKDCYTNDVAPQLQAQTTAHIPDDLTAAQDATDVYDRWLDGLVIAQGFFAGFTLNPELGQSQVLAAKLLRNWFDGFNLECIGVEDQPTAALLDAVLAFNTPDAKARDWGVATKANRLDYESLLDGLCVQIVIDPSRTYSATGSGGQGTVTVPVGYSIAGQPIRHDRPIDVELTVTGQSTPFSDGDAPADGVVSAPLTWPTGMDPASIDILASFDFSGNISDIARFDRITKHPTSLIAFAGQPTNNAPTQIYTIDPSTNVLTDLSNSPRTWDAYPSWSPDGSRIAFVRGTSPGGGALWVMNADGSNQHQLSSDLGVSDIVWDHAGGAILVARAGGRWAVDPTTGDDTYQVDSFGWHATISPDDKRVAEFAGGLSGIWVEAAAGLGRHQIAPTKFGNSGLDWSPDGTQIAFASDGIKLISPTGGAVRSLTTNPHDDWVSWSPDGTRIAFTRLSGGFNRLFVMPVSGGGARTLSGANMWDVRNVAWQP